MAVYRFVGRDVLNRLKRGVIEAKSLDQARELLLNQGVVVVERLKEDKSFLEKNVDLLFLIKISLKDILVFTRQLHALINAGIPLVQALRIVKEQIPNRRLRQVAEGVAIYIEEGGKFNVILSKYRNVFGDLYVSMIRAAEEAGTLEETLRKLAEHIEKVENLRGKVKSALFYPVFVLLVATVIVAGILIFVIPTFQKLYADLGGELPSLTQTIMGLSNWLRNYIGWVILVLVAFVIGFFQVRKLSSKFRYLTDLFFLKLPVFGDLILKSSVANFLRTLSSMLSSGINILDALQISSETANNEVIKRELIRVSEQVEKGITLSLAMSRIPTFPPMVVSMVAVGEEAGTLTLC